MLFTLFTASAAFPFCGQCSFKQALMPFETVLAVLAECRRLHSGLRHSDTFYLLFCYVS
jgi:hypothetical protein